MSHRIWHALQPALFVAGLAAVEKLRQDTPEAVAGCSAAAGLSLGEYTALVFAGALTFEDGLKVPSSPPPLLCLVPTPASPHPALSLYRCPTSYTDCIQHVLGESGAFRCPL